MELQHSDVGAVRKIVLEGRLDTHGVDQVETKFGAAIVPGARPTVVDLTGVSFMASMGIRMLISTTRSLSRKGAKLALYGAMPGVLEVIETTALGDIIPVTVSEAEAIAIVTG